MINVGWEDQVGSFFYLTGTIRMLEVYVDLPSFFFRSFLFEALCLGEKQIKRIVSIPLDGYQGTLSFALETKRV